MSLRAAKRAPSTDRRTLRRRLEDRLTEIEEATGNRIQAISDPSTVADPLYREGLRSTVSIAIEYGLEAIECGESRVPPPPPALLAQARLAARSGVDLDTVLRRYLAGYTLLGEYLIEELELAGLFGSDSPRELIRGQAAVLDRLLAGIAEEYARELRIRPDSIEKRRAARVRQLLAGEMIDTTDLRYELSGHHVSAIVSGSTAINAVRELALRIGAELMVVRPDGFVAWAWFGSACELDSSAIAVALSSQSGVSIAIGEPGFGLAGWRLTYEQAKAAFAVALRARATVRYADVALVTAILKDEILFSSLRQLYIQPLAAQRDGGEVALETLRAYFRSGRNVSSAAAALGVNRHTVASRLRTIEARLGCHLSVCAADVETVLRAEELELVHPGGSWSNLNLPDA